MMIERPRLVLCLALAAAACAAAPGGAAENPSEPWEFGIDPGAVYMVKGGQFGHDIPNAQVSNMLNTIGEGVAEEVGEGFPPLDPNGSSNIASSIPSLPELAAHVDYRFNEYVATGLEAGWGFKRNTQIDKQGIYDRKFLSLHDETQLFHAAPVGRVGRSFGPVRATLTAGPEVTVIWEHADMTFTDPDDHIQPYTIVSEASAFFGVVGGARLEWYCTDHGSLQLGIEYHKMFAPGGKFDFVTPKAGFVARF